MKKVQPDNHRRPEQPDFPFNPVQSPKQGDQNLVEPPQQAEEATWQTYRSSTSHAEPSGHLNRRGLREVGPDIRKPARRRSRPRRRESTDKDE